jgi:hypothetical protein
MEQIYPELNLRILEMSEGDLDFQKQLTLAIYSGLLELKENYIEGSTEKDDYKIQQIRHKLKPTLTMFELIDIIDELQAGKDIIENEGFAGNEFKAHYLKLLEILDIAINRVYKLTQ